MIHLSKDEALHFPNSIDSEPLMVLKANPKSTISACLATDHLYFIEENFKDISNIPPFVADDFVASTEVPEDKKISRAAVATASLAPVLSTVGRDVIRAILRRHDITSADEITSAWIKCSGYVKEINDDCDASGLRGRTLWTTIERTVKENFLSIDRLEKSSPGICKFLNEKFGICNFRRYPDKVLLRQREEADMTDLPYGIVLFPLSDWNGSFYGCRDILDKLFDQLDGRCALRVFEHGSKNSLARRLVTLNQKYGKMSFAVVGGHGSKNWISFDAGYDLTAEDLGGLRPERSHRFFEDGATLVLSSCSTGQETGIGQTLSEKFGIRVIAPDIPSGLSRISVTFDRQGKCLLNADYYKDRSRRMYESGEEIESKRITSW